MSTYPCLKGHISTEPDYCSECGTKIQDSPGISVKVEQLEPKTSSTQNKISCPACSAPHDPSSGNFCEICGYNFTTGVHGEIPPIKESTNPSPPTPKFLEITISIDPTLRSPESPEPPNQPPTILRLDKDSNLIGRRSEARGISPEVALNFDSAVSHRHALINRQSDGTFTVRDIDSANGTVLNKVELTPMVDAVLQDGDELILGHWTRIKVRFPNSPR